MDMDAATITSITAVAAAGVAAGKILWQHIDKQSTAITSEYDKQIAMLRVDLVECREEHKRVDAKIESHNKLSDEKLTSMNVKLIEMSKSMGYLEGSIAGYNKAQLAMDKRQREVEEQLDHQENES